MAFPTVEEVLTEAFPTAGTAHLVDMPASVNAGELLIIFFSTPGTGSHTTPTGWTSIANKASLQSRISAFAKDAAGTEGGTTVDCATAASLTASAHVYRISGWSGTLADDVDVSSGATAGGTTPDPDSVTAGWGSDDNLFIAFGCSGDDDEAFTAAPTNYTNLTNIVSGGGVNNGASTGSARRELASDSDDPDTFTIASTGQWVAFTLVVKPSAAAGGGAPPTFGDIMIGSLGGPLRGIL